MSDKKPTTAPGAGEPVKRPPKGHRQKGAGAIVKSKGEITVQGLQIKEWQRTPMKLLEEFCQGNKRPMPKYAEVKREGDGGVRFRLILQDPKRPGSDKDLIFHPDRGFVDDLDAKHTIALLALHHLEGTRAYETKLPEPYRTMWIALSGGGAKPAAAAAPAPAPAPKPAAAPRAPAAASAAPLLTRAGPSESWEDAAARGPAAPPEGHLASAAASAQPAAARASAAVPVAAAAAAAPVAPPAGGWQAAAQSKKAAAAAAAAAVAAAEGGAPPPLPPPLPPAAAAPAGAGAPPPAGKPPPRLAANAVDVSVRLQSTVVSAADRKRLQVRAERGWVGRGPHDATRAFSRCSGVLQAEREVKAKERANRRAARLAELARRGKESIVSMSAAVRDLIAGILREQQQQAQRQQARLWGGG